MTEALEIALFELPELPNIPQKTIVVPEFTYGTIWGDVENDVFHSVRAAAKNLIVFYEASGFLGTVLI